MLKTIERISNAAVFGSYSGRASSLSEFARYNLIYGWNASGKTTLSRVFGLLTTGGASRLPNGASCKFTSDIGALDTRNESDKVRFNVRVFNRDFIDDNFKDHTSAPALFIVGSENIRLSNRISQISRRRELLAEMYRSAQRISQDATKARDRHATELATTCGTALGIRAFRSPDLKTLAAQIGSNASDSLLNEKGLDAAISAARNRDELTSFRTPLFQLPLKIPEATDIAEILLSTPQQNTIQRLAENRALAEWIRSGLRFHEKGTECEFCGGDAKSSLEAYAKHFSGEYQSQHAAILVAIQRLASQEQAPTLPHEKDWAPTLRHDVGLAMQALKKWYDSENEIRKVWRDQLQQKLDNMDARIPAQDAGDRLPLLARIFSDLNRLASEHNRACMEAASIRIQAAEVVKKHFAVRYLLDEEAVAQIAAIEKANYQQRRVEKAGQKAKTSLTMAQEELQKSSVAATQLNSLLNSILGSRVSVQQAENGQLRFTRGGEPATNLSDGEKTAVSLAYFLVSLQQNGQSASNTIVFVDDPICSLDANHIYDVAYLLLRYLKDAKQLFIATHNSEFFNTIKQNWTSYGTFKPGHRGYLVHRKNETESEIIDLPTHLAKFRSDYHHVFFCLTELRKSTSQDISTYIHSPNLVRRFLEMYLGFRVPAASGFEKKLDILIDDEATRDALAHFADEGSHSQTSLRLLEFSDFPAMAKRMIERLLLGLEEKDPADYEALKNATGSA